MQIILVSRHLKAARTITIMPRHLVLALVGFVLLVFLCGWLFSWLSVHWRLPLVEHLLRSVQQEEAQRSQDYLSNNLRLMATRIGELQSRVLQLDALSQRLAGVAGLKSDTGPGRSAGEGGPFLPELPSEAELERGLERLAADVDRRSAQWSALESRLLERRVLERLLPTALPVKNANYGSPYGVRSDPIAGLRAMHEGIDFVAEIGTPVVAAADGVVITADYHADFGHLIEIDHGEGLLSRYAHLSRLDVAAGRLVRRDERIGAVGNSGRSTGPHLHFEVRMLGVAQNPAAFLKQGSEFAQLKQRR